MKQPLWEKLLVVLQDVLVLYQALFSLSEQKRQILVAAKAKELEKVTKEEEVILLKTAQMEKVRKHVVEEISQCYGRGGTRMTLAELQQLAEPDVAKVIGEQSEKLMVVIEQLQQQNELNTRLIEQALGHIQFNINVLSQSAVGPSYVPEGEKEQAEARVKRVFDAKV